MVSPEASNLSPHDSSFRATTPLRTILGVTVSGLFASLLIVGVAVWITFTRVRNGVDRWCAFYEVISAKKSEDEVRAATRKADDSLKFLLDHPREALDYCFVEMTRGDGRRRSWQQQLVADVLVKAEVMQMHDREAIFKGVYVADAGESEEERSRRIQRAHDAWKQLRSRVSRNFLPW